MLPERTLAGLSQVSVVIPILNDRKHLARLLPTLASYKNFELIVVDGGSNDDPHEIAKDTIFLHAIRPSRGAQVSMGIMHASRDRIWVLHVDCLIDDGIVESLVIALNQARWGRFDVTLLGSRWEYRMIESLMNVRSRLTGICTGDQGMFFHRDILTEIGGFPEQPLMEDVEVSKRLRKLERPFCSKNRLGVSTRKWDSNGVFRTIVRMWGYRIKYFLGVSPESLYAEYYR